MARAILVGTTAIRPDAAANHARGTAPRGATDADGKSWNAGGNSRGPAQRRAEQVRDRHRLAHQVALPTPIPQRCLRRQHRVQSERLT